MRLPLPSALRVINEHSPASSLTANLKTTASYLLKEAHSTPFKESECRALVLSTKTKSSGKSKKRPTTQADLPVEIWFVIFSKLDIVSLLVASQVQKRWNKITSDPSIWRNLCFTHQVSLEDEDAQRLFQESLELNGLNFEALSLNHRLPSTNNAWKKIFIRHYKMEQKNRVLGKLFWATYEINAMERLLNVGRMADAPRLLTYDGAAGRCLQCERERELLERLEVIMHQDEYGHHLPPLPMSPPTTSRSSTSSHRGESLIPSARVGPRTLYACNGMFFDRLGPHSLPFPTRSSLILHTLSDGCDHGSGLLSLMPRSMLVRSRSPYLSSLLHESLIGSSFGLIEQKGQEGFVGVESPCRPVVLRPDIN